MEHRLIDGSTPENLQPEPPLVHRASPPREARQNHEKHQRPEHQVFDRTVVTTTEPAGIKLNGVTAVLGGVVGAACGASAGTGGAGATGKPAKLPPTIVWASNTSQADLPYFQRFAQWFEEQNPGTKVDLLLPPGDGAYEAKMIAMFAGGTFPDVFHLHFSRLREFRADAGSAALLGTPQPMIRALQRLHGVEPGALPQAIQSFGITSSPRGFMALFASPPPVEERIAALTGARG